MNNFLLRYIAYAGFGCVFVNHTGILRGKQQDSFYQTIAFVFLLRAYVFSLFWIPLYYVSPDVAKIFLLYAPLYLDLSEFNGKRRMNSWIKEQCSNFVSQYLDAKLIKTVDINVPCILAMHHHGLLPFAATCSIGTEANDFSLLFPALKDRLLVAASAVFMVPFFRDLALLGSIMDCNKWNMEHWIRHGSTVGVFPGGAREACYSDPENEVLDLKRKLGFLRLSLKYNVPIVPVYTFNETDHFYQLTYHTCQQKYPVLFYINQVFHNTTGE